MRVLFSTVLFLALAGLPAAAGAGPGEANECGCYRDAKGNCRCNKGGRCACPGDCEPVGCEAKRQKQAEKDAAAALKRIQAREKQKTAEAAREKQKQEKENAKTEKEKGKGKGTEDKKD